MSDITDASSMKQRLPMRVLKLGGSLLDLPDLPDRFNRYVDFLHEQQPCRVLLVVGGGVAADAVRDYDRRFQLGEALGHDLAVRGMSFNAQCMARILPGTLFAQAVNDAHACWQASPRAAVVIEPVAWLQTLEAQGLAIERAWQFTSDSIAAAIAGQLHADALTLLKSTLPQVSTIDQAMEAGLVDRCFARASLRVKRVEAVNLRSENWLSRVLER